MIYKVQDLLEAFRENDCDIIAHQANCFQTMAAGIAKQIVKEYPEVRDADNLTIRGEKSKLGTYSVATVGEKFIFNLYGQFLPGPNTQEEKLKESLQKMATFLYPIRNKVRIGLPMLGCGIGGGNWKRIESIIESVFIDEGFDVTIYVRQLVDKH